MHRLEDALTCIRLHFTQPSGLIAQIEQGSPVDEPQVQTIEMALQTLHIAWQEQALIPKEDVRLLWNVLPRLEKCLITFPERKTEITHVIFRITQWIDTVFTSSKISEETAIAVVSQHLIGPSFGVELRAGTINGAALEDLLLALDTLAQVWKNREHVSKLAAGAIVSMQDIVESVSGLYTEPEMKRLRNIEQQLFEHASKCLS